MPGVLHEVLCPAAHAVIVDTTGDAFRTADTIHQALQHSRFLCCRRRQEQHRVFFCNITGVSCCWDACANLPLVNADSHAESDCTPQPIVIRQGTRRWAARASFQEKLPELAHVMLPSEFHAKRVDALLPKDLWHCRVRTLGNKQRVPQNA